MSEQIQELKIVSNGKEVVIKNIDDFVTDGVVIEVNGRKSYMTGQTLIGILQEKYASTVEPLSKEPLSL